MNRKTYGMIATLSGAILLLVTQASISSAQSRGASSDDFFQQGNDQLEQDVNNLQNPPAQPDLTTEEKQLDNNLNIQQPNPDEPKGSEDPAPNVQYDNNVPDSPDDEVEVKF